MKQYLTLVLALIPLMVIADDEDLEKKEVEEREANRRAVEAVIYFLQDGPNSP